MKVCLATFSNDLGFHGPIATEYESPNIPGSQPEKNKLKWEIYPAKPVPGVKVLTADEIELFKEDLEEFNNTTNRIKAYLPFLTEDVLYNCWSWSGPFFYLTWSDCEPRRLSDGTAQDVRVKLHLKSKPSDYTRFPRTYRKNVISTGDHSHIPTRGCTEDNAEKIIGAQVLIKIGVNLIIFEGKIKICIGANYETTTYGDHVGFEWDFVPGGGFLSENKVTKRIIDELQEMVDQAGTPNKPRVRVAVVGLFDDYRPQRIFANDASFYSAKSNWKIFRDGWGSDMIIVSNESRITTCHMMHVYRKAPKLKELVTTSPNRDHILKLDLTEEHVKALLLYQYSRCSEWILKDSETCLCILKFADKYEMWDMWKDIMAELVLQDTTFFGGSFVDEFNSFLTRCTKRNETTTKKLKRTVEERIDFLKKNCEVTIGPEPDKLMQEPTKRNPEEDQYEPLEYIFEPVESPYESEDEQQEPAQRRQALVKSRCNPLIQRVKRKRLTAKRKPSKRQHSKPDASWSEALQHIQIETSNNDALGVYEQPTKSIREEKGTKNCKAVIGPEPEKQMQEPAKRNPEEGQDEPLEHELEPDERQHEPEQRQQTPAKRRYNPMIRRAKRKRLTAKRKPSKRQHPKPDVSWTEALQRGEQSNKRLWEDVINKNCKVVIGPRDIVKAPGLNKIAISAEFKIEKVEPNELEEHQE